MFGKKKEFVSVGPLVDGLPVPALTPIIAKLIPEGFNLKALIGTKKENWKEFNLSLNKIQNVQLMNEWEIQQVIQQSVPGMILGAAAFGALGAMVGGRVQTKEKIKVSTLLVIDYESDGGKQIVLNVSDNLKDSEQVVKQFQNMKPVQNSPVQL